MQRNRPEYVDTLTARRLIGVSRWTLMRWWRRGLLERYVTHTGRNRWNRAEVQELVRKVQRDEA